MACSKEIELMKGALVRVHALTRHLPDHWSWFFVPKPWKKIVEQINKEAEGLVSVKCGP